VTFVKNPSELLETKRQPYNAHFNMHRHPRLTPAIYQISINGPYDSTGPGDTPSRRRILGNDLVSPGDEDQRAERILEIGTLGGYTTTVRAITRSGSIVAGESTLAGEMQVHAFVWTRRRGMIDLGTLGGRYSYTGAISDSGTVVGWSGLATGNLEHAFVWTEADGLLDLSPHNSESTHATAINRHGVVTGVRYVATADPRVSVSQACVWTSIGRTLDIGTLGGPFSWPFGIGNDGRVVGMSQIANGSTHAFVWSRTNGLVDLSR